MQSRDALTFTTKPFLSRRDIPASVAAIRSAGYQSELTDSLKFPLAQEQPSPWRPQLSGEGEFPMQDAAKMAQLALERLESGMLRLHEEAGFTPPSNGPRGRAA